jgi:hypothetical protein
MGKISYRTLPCPFIFISGSQPGTQLPLKQLVVGASDFDSIDFLSLRNSGFDLQIRMLAC